jgi:hypothetical protein
MALFGRTPEPSRVVKAAAGSNAGASQINNFYSYVDGTARQRCMAVPAISRARDLLASVISCMPLVMYKEMWNGEEMEQVPEAPRSWLRRLDKSVPNSTLLAWLFDDIFFTQRGFLYVTERTSDGFPTSFTRLPSAMVTTLDQAGPVFYAPSKQILFNGLPIRHEDVIQFISPIQGLIYTSPQAIETAIRLERARLRNSQATQPAVTLRQVGGEPMSGQELADMAAAFDNARLSNSTAAVNEFVEVVPNNATPDKMLLIEAANYQALEMARLANIPPYLVGVSTGAYSYQSSEQARMDLYMFGAKVYADCIAETLSSDNVLPRGTYVKFDVESYLGETLMGDTNEIYVEENTQESRA